MPKNNESGDRQYNFYHFFHANKASITAIHAHRDIQVKAKFGKNVGIQTPEALEEISRKFIEDSFKNAARSFIAGQKRKLHPPSETDIAKMKERFFGDIKSPSPKNPGDKEVYRKAQINIDYDLRRLMDTAIVTPPRPN